MSMFTGMFMFIVCVKIPIHASAKLPASTTNQLSSQQNATCFARTKAANTVFTV